MADLSLPSSLAPVLPSGLLPDRTPRRGALPTPLTSFVGRERETQAILDLLRRPGVRLITLTGPSGVGKTRLAMHAAAEATGDFPDGVRFVSLAAIRDAGLHVEAEYEPTRATVRIARLAWAGASMTARGAVALTGGNRALSFEAKAQDVPIEQVLSALDQDLPVRGVVSLDGRGGDTHDEAPAPNSGYAGASRPGNQLDRDDRAVARFGEIELQDCA